MKEGEGMKILKIKGGKGFFRCGISCKWKPVDQIDKDDLMRLLDIFVKKDVSMDPFDETLIKNQAQQIIYKSIFEKFNFLMGNKSRFKDESERTYLNELQRYQVSEPSSE